MRSACPSITTASTLEQSASFPITSRSRRAFAASVSAYRSNGNVSSFWKATAASHRFGAATGAGAGGGGGVTWRCAGGDRKSTRLNSSHLVISYAVFCLKKKKISSHREGGDG